MLRVTVWGRGWFFRVRYFFVLSGSGWCGCLCLTVGFTAKIVADSLTVVFRWLCFSASPAFISTWSSSMPTASPTIRSLLSPPGAALWLSCFVFSTPTTPILLLRVKTLSGIASITILWLLSFLIMMKPSSLKYAIHYGSLSDESLIFCRSIFWTSSIWNPYVLIIPQTIMRSPFVMTNITVSATGTISSQIIIARIYV